MRYPDSSKDDQVDELHGQKIADPYRWLEDPRSARTRAWVDAQNRLTFGFLEGIPERAAYAARLKELWNYERRGVPSKQGGRYFLFKNDGLQNQAVLYTSATADGPLRLLLDPNALSPDGTIALMGMSYSDDGKLLAYGLSSAGSDWQEWRVRDTDTGQDLPDKLEWVRFSSASFSKDGKGFYYSRYDEPPDGAAHTAIAEYQKLCYHELGTPQSADRLIYERKDHKEWGFAGEVTEDGQYLIISVWHGTDPKNRLFYKDLAAGGPVVELLPEADAAYHFIGNAGRKLWLHTNLDAPRGRIVEIDLDVPARERWREVVPQARETLLGTSYVGGRFLSHYLKDAHSQVKAFDPSGRVHGEIELPGLGTVGGFAGRSDDTETFYSFTSFSVPSRTYRFDVATGQSKLHWAPSVPFDPDAYETRQVFYTSKDGTRVPMFINHKKGLVLDGTNATYLYGYGGFNIPITPAFDVTRLVWMEHGGVAVIANLRGGGEYGEDWHQAGCGKQRQNVFDDFIAAAEWLQANKYTSPKKLAIAGSSNGGLLVGAVMTQRPELFGVALPDVGVLDMLRFHKFTIGWAWISDYGSPDDPDDFQVLRAYSPLHNVKPGTSYPATLITTADTDDRVVSAHSFKFAAALQAAQAGEAPILIRVETRAGHGAGTPTAKLIEVAADRWSFVLHMLKGSK